MSLKAFYGRLSIRPRSYRNDKVVLIKWFFLTKVGFVRKWHKEITLFWKVFGKSLFCTNKTKGNDTLFKCFVSIKKGFVVCPQTSTFFCPLLVKQRATSRHQKRTSDFFLHRIKEGFVLFFAKKSNKMEFRLFFCCRMLNRSTTLASSYYCLVFTKRNPQVWKKMEVTQNRIRNYFSQMFDQSSKDMK